MPLTPFTRAFRATRRRNFGLVDVDGFVPFRLRELNRPGSEVDARSDEVVRAVLGNPHGRRPCTLGARIKHLDRARGDGPGDIGGRNSVYHFGTLRLEVRDTGQQLRHPSGRIEHA